MNCPGDFYDYEENDSDHGHDNEDFDQENEETNIIILMNSAHFDLSNTTACPGLLRWDCLALKT